MTAKTIGAALASVALVASVAGPAVTAEAAPTTSRAAASTAVTIDAKRMITMPATVQPGVNEFHVTSAKPSGFQLISLAADYTSDEAEADIKAGLEGGKMSALRRMERNVTLIGGVSSVPGKAATFWVDLEPGVYIALDVAGKTNAAKWVTLTVSGLDTGLSMPSGSTVKAVRDAKWAKKPASIPRKGTLTFRNRSTANHFVFMARMARGATLADVKQWLMTEKGKPPLDFSTSLDTAVISPGHDLALDYKLPAGTYAMLCFWPDASMGGMPHAAMGMVRTIKLR